MKSIPPEVRLARLRNNTVDWNLDTQEITIRLGAQEIKVCKECFAQLTEVLDKARHELSLVEREHATRESDQRLQQALSNLDVKWIEAGVKRR